MENTQRMTPCKPLVFIFVSLMACALGETSLPKPVDPNNRPTSVFNEASAADGVKMKNLRKLTFASLKKSWFEAPVTRNRGMFNPVFLPFRYSIGAGTNDPRQGLAFPCLLSLKFDFVPDNYTARHPAFIFRRGDGLDIEPGQTDRIAYYIKDWQATHAIAGSVMQHEDGVTGRLIVYDRTGKEILTQDYETRVPYFTLMGQMVKTWMDFRQQSVSEGLYRELIRPMTKDPECLRLYSESFTKKWRTQSEWDVFDQILDRDPNFGEVRFWYANQKAWQTGGSTQSEKGRALMDHLVMPALYEFDPQQCDDSQIVQNFYDKLSYAQSICGENATVLGVMVEVNGASLGIDQLDAYLPMAEKYPCYWPLICNLAREYRRRGIYEKSIPLFLSAVRSGYMPGSGSFQWEWAAVMEDLYRLGYYNDVIFCGWMALNEDPDDKKAAIYTHLAGAYRELFDFQTAATLFTKSQANENADNGALSCIYQNGDLNRLRKLNETRESANVLIDARELAFQGKFEEASKKVMEYRNNFTPRGRMYSDFEAELAAADISLLSGDLQTARTCAVRAWYAYPRSRQVGFLLSKAFEGDEVVLGRYAAVESFIFEDSPLRESPVALVEMPLPFSQKDLSVRFAEIKKQSAGPQMGGTPAFWRRFQPFETEYVCLGLLKTDPSMAAEVLDLYRNYAKSAGRISHEQYVHVRTFYKKLVNLLPPDDRWAHRVDII